MKLSYYYSYDRATRKRLDYIIVGMTKRKPTPSSIPDVPHLTAAMARPFIAGARVQLERYLEAQTYVTTYHVGMTGYDRCMYELSSLFEHLATVAIYLKRSGVELPIEQTIADTRNQIRHDARGEADMTNGKRAERLGINPKLLVHIVFSNGGVTVGNTELTAAQIGQFLDTAEMTMNALMLGGKVEVNASGVVVSP